MFGMAWAFVAHADSRFDRDAVPLRAGLSGGPAAHDRRALGDLDHAADRACRESSAAGRSGSWTATPHARRRTTSPTGCWALATRPNRRWRFCPPYEMRPLPDAFAVQLIHRLRDQDPKVTPVLTWLDDRLAAQGTTADVVVREEHQRQGSATVTVRNIITSLRTISDVDWSELFERMSLVDKALGASGLSRRWIFRPAISIAAQSNSLRAGRPHDWRLHIARRAVGSRAAACAGAGVAEGAGAIRAII